MQINLSVNEIDLLISSVLDSLHEGLADPEESRALLKRLGYLASQEMGIVPITDTDEIQ
jgi:hypothetical protein